MQVTRGRAEPRYFTGLEQGLVVLSIGINMYRLEEDRINKRSFRGGIFPHPSEQQGARIPRPSIIDSREESDRSD